MPFTSAEAARLYLARGWQPVAVAAGSKGPQEDGWHHVRYDEADLPAAFPVGSNIGIILGEPSGGLVDVDLDCPEAIDFAAEYLPRTEMFSGRAGKRFSHYWYKVETPGNTKQYRGPDRKMIIELRSSDGSKGFQTLVYPSIHPETKEAYEWEGGECGEPGIADFDDLLVRVRLVAAGALLARHFPERGSRHEFALALGGALLTYGTDVEDAHKFVYEVCRVGKSDDPAKRADTVYSTAERTGERTGIPRLKEIVGDKVVKKICEWLDLGTTVGDVGQVLADKVRARLGAQAAAKAEPKDEAKAAPAAAVEGEEDTSWVDKLKKDKQGFVKCGYNAYTILKNTNDMKSVFRWNDVAKQVEASGIFSAVESDILDIVTTDWLAEEFDVFLSKSEVADRILRIAYDNRFDPIKDYLRSVVWDKTPRIDQFLIDYANVATTSDDRDISRIIRLYSRRWFISAAARALDPGCKVDNVLILEGSQGIYKSRMFKTLGGPWFSDTKLNLDGNKDSLMRAAAFWIIELSELAALKSAKSSDDPKGFLSSTVDDYRVPYGKAIASAPRRCVFTGTVNPDPHGYLTDKTGNRRYWCCTCKGEIDIQRVRRDRDQLWAEAVAMFDAAKDCEACEEAGDEHGCVDHRWWFSRAEQIDVDRENGLREIDDPWFSSVYSWWYDTAPSSRPSSFTAAECAKGALKIAACDLDHSKQVRLGIILKAMGFEFKRTRQEPDDEGKRERPRVYFPTDDMAHVPQTEVGKRRSALVGIPGGKK